jgi:Ca2+-binding EF-hand superfamily protein
MTKTSKVGIGIALVSVGYWFSLASTGMAQAATPPSTSTARAAMRTLDTDADGTIDLKEAKKAAERHFAALDTDHDGTLDPKEAAAAGITASEFSKVDVDKDGTLDKAEYWALVRARFKAADRDHDGMVLTQELATSEGGALLAVLQ